MLPVVFDLGFAHAEVGVCFVLLPVFVVGVYYLFGVELGEEFVYEFGYGVVGFVVVDVVGVVLWVEGELAVAGVVHCICIGLGGCLINVVFFVVFLLFFVIFCYF